MWFSKGLDSCDPIEVVGQETEVIFDEIVQTRSNLKK